MKIRVMMWISVFHFNYFLFYYYIETLLFRTALSKTTDRGERKKKKRRKGASGDFQRQMECFVIEGKATSLFGFGAAIKEVFCFEICLVRMS